MQKDKKERQLLAEIFKNLNMGMQSINDLLPKVEDTKIKNELVQMYENYDKFSTQAHLLAENENFDVKTINPFKKAMLWSSIQLNILKDDSSNHILSMLIQGSVMGYTSIMQTLQESGITEGKVYDLANDFIQMQQKDEKKLTALLAEKK